MGIEFIAIDKINEISADDDILNEIYDVLEGMRIERKLNGLSRRDWQSIISNAASMASSCSGQELRNSLLSLAASAVAWARDIDRRSMEISS